MVTNERQIGVGVVGCGGFGLFALQQFVQLPGVYLAGIASTHPEAARAAIGRFDIPDVVHIEDLVRLPGVDLIYIATPPFLHYSQAMQSLEGGKHVLVEKPTGLNLAEVDEMMRVAHSRDLLLATDLMQRYNPMFDAVRGLIERKPLGELLHAYFENYASDEDLSPEHWFWDRDKSGGIFVEHGVHFFDLFAGWLGAGVVEAAQVSRRPGTTIEDQVQCTVRYRDDVLVNFYHGFTQPGRMDRQEMRLVFERGDIRLEEWVPIRATIHALVDEHQTRVLCDLFPGASLDITANYGGKNRACRGRHKSLDVYQMIEMRYGYSQQKMHRYGELIRSLFADQIAFINDRQHVRKLTEQDARHALALAADADRLAHSPRA